MKYLPDVKRLNEILWAEINGLPFDAVEADSLAERLLDLCPDIAETLAILRRRIAPQLLADCA